MPDELDRDLLCRSVGILEAILKDGLPHDLKLVAQWLTLEFRGGTT